MEKSTGDIPMNNSVATSISDNPSYNEICGLAASQDCYFEYFKSMAQYAEILEHVSEKQGQEYLELIDRQLLQHLDVFATNDSVGNPIRYEYENWGLFSPTTLRYVKVLSDLQKLFITLTGMDIVEIGAGYGGQCKIIHDSESPGSYNIVDLPNALALQRKYLNKFDIKNGRINSFTADNLYALPNQIDLVISNYAFSECNVDVQHLYMEKIIKHSKCGYMTMNYIDSFASELGFMTQKELLAEIPNSRIIVEQPLTAEGNYIIVWGV